MQIKPISSRSRQPSRRERVIEFFELVTVIKFIYILSSKRIVYIDQIFHFRKVYLIWPFVQMGHINGDIQLYYFLAEWLMPT